MMVLLLIYFLGSIVTVSGEVLEQRKRIGRQCSGVTV